jgi:DNA-binding transcriptional MerR regulator/effector-binding domain-containing protein
MAECCSFAEPSPLDPPARGGRTLQRMEQKTELLLPIGRFSRLSGLSVKALRHYDAIGLLNPARVDEDSGYRLYALEQLRDAGAIARLRALDVPLDECKAILADPGSAERRLAEHRTHLEQRATELKGQLALLDSILSGRTNLEQAAPLEKIEVREVEDQPVLTMRSRSREDDLDRAIGTAINGVAAYLRELGEESAGPPFNVRGEPDDDDLSEVEIGWPTAHGLPARPPIESRSMPAGRAAWAVFRGPYEELPAAYRAVYEWTLEHGHEPAGSPREIYYSDPDETPDPADYVTGIVWPLQAA